MSGSRSTSQSESEIRAVALNSLLRYNRLANEMDPRAFSEGEIDDYGDIPGYGYGNYDDYGDYEDGNSYFDGGYHVDEDQRRAHHHRRHRSRSRSRDKSPRKSPSKSSSNSVVRVPRDKARLIRKWAMQGLAKDESKALRESVKLEFEGSFKVDESMIRQMSRGRSYGNSSPLNNRPGWGANSNDRNGGGNRYSPYPNQGNRGRGGYQQRGQHQQRGQQNFRYFSSSFFHHHPAPPSSESSVVGARLAFFISEWVSFTSDPWILSIISNGYFIDFIDDPVQLRFPHDCVMSAEMAAVCDEEVKALLLKKAVIRIPRPVDGFVSNMFATKKKKENEDDPQLWRPIANLKRLNSFVYYEHFKMEGLDLVKFIIRKGDWMAKVDLKDAYFTVPVAAEHKKYLRFVWKGEFFQYVCLPLPFLMQPAGRPS